MNILVTGGAGYIGSHTSIELINAGYEVIIVDNLCNSNFVVVNRIQEITAHARRVQQDHEAHEPRGSEEDFVEPGSGAVGEGGLGSARRVRRRGVRGVARCRQGEGHGLHLRPRDSGRAFVRSGGQDLKVRTQAASRARVDRGFSFDLCRFVDRFV